MNAPKFGYVLHRGTSFNHAFLIPAGDPKLSIIVQPDGDTFSFARILNTRPDYAGPRSVLGWAAEAGVTIPDTFLQARDGRQYVPKEKSPWATLEDGEVRPIPLDLLVKRLWPNDRTARIEVRDGVLVVCA